MTDNGKTDKVMQAQPSQQDEQNNLPIVLNLTLGKVNYILSMLAQLPYEKSYQPIQDLQQMVMAQLQPVADATGKTVAANTETPSEVAA